MKHEHFFLLFWHIVCLKIYGTRVTAYNSINNYFVFFFVSDLKIAYYNNY